MLRFVKEKDFLHPLVIWLMLLLWYGVFAHSFFSIPRARLDHFIAEQSFWLFNHPPKEAEKITIIAIDETSRRRLNRKWPWKRSMTAQLIRNIASFSPRVIGVDLVFSGRSEEEDDRALISALESHPGIILAYVANKDSEEKPIDDFIGATASLGFVNKPLHEGVIDRTRTFQIVHHQEPAFSLEVEVLLSYLGLSKDRLSVSGQGIFHGNELLVPSAQSLAPLNYKVHPLSFTTIPASLVLENKVNPKDLSDRIVLIGVTDPLIHDEYLTPMGLWPGVSIVANALVMMLSKQFLYSASTGQNLAVIGLVGLLILCLNKRPRFLLNTSMTTVVLISLYLSFLYLRAENFHFAYLPILFSGASAFLVANLYQYSNLLFLSNRLKTLAITDPLTGFCSARYFLLQLDERLKSKDDLLFVALRIANYRQLTLRLSFDEIKQWTRLLGERLQRHVESRFKNVLFSRLSNDTLALVLKKSRGDEITRFLRDFVQKTKGPEWELEGGKARISLQGCLISRFLGKKTASEDLLYQMEGMFRRTNQDQILEEDFTVPGTERKNVSQRNILDFIAYDWEERNKDLEKSLRETLDANKRMDQLNWGTLKALARAIDAKSQWTAGHSEQVTRLALEVGLVLGLSQEEQTNLHQAALLHDIGKIGIPAELIDKPGKLTEEEVRLIREHPVIGARILEPIDAYAEIIPIVRQHHEWFNGNGYPDGLAGEAITLGARILAVVDVYDAISSQRPYRPGLEPDQALEVIKQKSGNHFDPVVVEAFLRVIEKDKKAVRQHDPLDRTGLTPARP